MRRYSTVTGPGEAEQTIERSRFITHVRPVETREEADLFFEELRKTYRDATHNVPALVLGDKAQIQWASDDGEPQGTSGAPMVQYLVAEGLTNVALMVTRYFGGIKLGTGGLVRAYTSSAKIGVLAAGIGDVEEMAVFSFKIDYKAFNKVQSHVFGAGTSGADVRIENIQYTDVVCFDLVCDPDDAEAIREELDGVTAGAVQLMGECRRDVLVPRIE